MSSRPDLPPVRADGLQLDEQRGWQEGYWRVQRIAWCGFWVVVLLAALGLTGAGGVFHSQTIDFGAATAEMPRVTRWKGSDTMAVTFHDPADRHAIRIGQSFFDRFSIERIQPEPADAVLMPGAQSWAFSSTGDPPHTVGIDLRAGHFGWTGFDMTINGQTRRVSLIVLP